MEFNFGDDPDPDPCLQAAQLRHKLAGKYLSGSEKTKALGELKQFIVENNMTEYGKFCSESVSGLNISKNEFAAMKAKNEEEIKKIEAEIADAEENMGEIEVLDGKKKLADYKYTTGSKDLSLEAFTGLHDLKGMSTGQKIDNELKKMRLGLLWKDFDILQTSIEECESLMEVGGDWERRNRLKVYRGIFNLMLRKFKEASDDLLATVATFTCTELCPYEEFIRYAVVAAIVSLDRVEFKKQVIDSSQVKAVYKSFNWLPEFVHTLYEADYATFFAAISHIYPQVEKDRYLSDHAKWWVRELRIRTYSQFLEPFKSVTLEMMGYEFGLSQAFLDKELSKFIAAGRIQAKLDKANGIVETSKQTTTHLQYQEVIKHGDTLLNKVQQLSRLLGV